MKYNLKKKFYLGFAPEHLYVSGDIVINLVKDKI